MKFFFVEYLKKYNKKYLWGNKIREAVNNDSRNVSSRIFNDIQLEGDDAFAYDQEFVKKAVDCIGAIAMNAKAFLIDANEHIELELDADAKKKIADLVSEMVTIACEEILDNNGRVKKDIMTIMGLDLLVRKWTQESQSDKLKMFLPHLISGYISQVLIGAIVYKWQKLHPQMEDALRRFGLVTMAITKVLGHGLSPALLKKIRGFAFFSQTPSAGLAPNLAALTETQIGDLIKEDLQSRAEQRPAVQRIFADLRKEKVNFWNEVAEHLNNCSNTKGAQAITKAIEDAEPQAGSIFAPLLGFFSFSAAQVKPEKTPSALATNHALRNWINVRDNFCVINSVISYIAQHCNKDLVDYIYTLGQNLDSWLGYITLTESDKTILKELESARFDGEQIRWAPRLLLSEYSDRCANGSELQKILKDYIDALPEPQSAQIAEQKFRQLRSA